MKVFAKGTMVAVLGHSDRVMYTATVIRDPGGSHFVIVRAHTQESPTLRLSRNSLRKLK